MTAAAVTTSALAFAPAASAETIGGIHQVRAAVPIKVDRHINFIPVNTMGQLKPFRAYVGRGQYVRGPWVNFSIGRESMSEELGYMRRGVGNGMVVFTDRTLTRAERRRFVVVADFGRDADVMVVKRGHPACAGLTLAQARGIARGKITLWSQVGKTPPDGSDRIAVRHPSLGNGYVEPRFGAPVKPRAGKPSRDGGLSEAAKDSSVAGFTGWASARYRSDVCAVPLGGVTPTNVSVHSLEYPGAYPVGIVAPRKLMRDRYNGFLIRRYAKFFESEAAAKLMRRTGLLIKRDPVSDPAPNPQPGGGSGGPSQDAQGRPITPIRDDAAATSTLTGERIEREGLRWIFEPESAFHLLEPDCQRSTGSWSMVEGWTYSENGGGVIARVQISFEESHVYTIELPSASPGTAYIDGQQFARSRDLPASC